jgi:hypothetical protein
MKTFDLTFNSYYIAGYKGGELYLGNNTAPLLVYKLNTQLTDGQKIQIKVDSIQFKKIGNYKLSVDSSKFYLFNGLSRSVLTGTTDEWKGEIESLNTPFFAQVAPIGNHSLVFRMISHRTGNNSLRKESRNKRLIDNETILEKQVDGLFCTEGNLQYNDKLKQLVYVYYYRNQILLIDTNLNLIKKIKTIDPIDSAKFTIDTLRSSNVVTFSSPPLFVNPGSSLWGQYIFIQSKVMGKGEDEVLFTNSTVIDIYDLQKGTYLYSLYLPNLNHVPIRQFRVIDGYIFTMHDHSITRYEVKLPR